MQRLAIDQVTMLLDLVDGKPSTISIFKPTDIRARHDKQS
jgi:hypothetical protein